MSADHLDNISIAITMASAPLQQAGFGRLNILVDEAEGTGNGLPAAVRFVIYTSAAAAQVDQTAGDITAAVLLAVTAAFSQRPQPADVMVTRVDTVAAETYSVALGLADVAGAEYYGVAADTRTSATIAALALTIEATRKLYVFQSSDADWITTGIPAALSAIDGYEKTAGVYHDADAAWADVAFAANRLVYDPDTRSASWDAPVKGVSAYTTAPTDAQKAFLDANDMNHGLPYAGETFFVDAGVNMAGRPIYEIITADWFETRLEEQIATLKVNLSARGQKLPITATGQALVLAEIRALFEQGIGAGHFVDGETEVVAEAITAADTTAQRLRFTGRAQLAASARIFLFTFDFGLSALAAA